MTVVLGLDDALIAALQPHLPEKAIATAVDPAKAVETKHGAIWVRGIKSDSKWRGMGGSGAASHARRAETLAVSLSALAYRESRNHLDAAADAKAVVVSLIVAVEQTLEADDDLSIGGAVDWSMVEDFLLETWPHESGWCAGAVINLKCESRP